MKDLFYNDISEAEALKTELLERVILDLHHVLKHEIKTGILAQIRVFEYLISILEKNETAEFIDLIKLSYETSLEQYELVNKALGH